MSWLCLVYNLTFIFLMGIFFVILFKDHLFEKKKIKRRVTNLDTYHFEEISLPEDSPFIDNDVVDGFKVNVDVKLFRPRTLFERAVDQKNSGILLVENRKVRRNIVPIVTRRAPDLYMNELDALLNGNINEINRRIGLDVTDNPGFNTLHKNSNNEQTVHDSQVQATMKLSIEKIREALKGKKIYNEREFFDEIKNVVKNPGDLQRFMRESPLYKDSALLVWSRINDPDNVANKEDLVKSFKDTIENKEWVVNCSGGKLSRIIQTLEKIDVDPDLVSLKPTWAIKEEILGKAGTYFVAGMEKERTIEEIKKEYKDLVRPDQWNIFIPMIEAGFA